MSLKSILLCLFALWLVVGMCWLLPKKLALVRRRGNMSNAHFIALAKKGDAEVMHLVKLTRWFLVAGLLIGLPIALLR
jgi:hypothetical protein